MRKLCYQLVVVDGGRGGALSIFGRGAVPRAVLVVSRRRFLVQKTLRGFLCKGEEAGADGDSIVSLVAGYGSARSD